MSKFFVGQRVRIVGPSDSESVGREATVVSGLHFGPLHTSGGLIETAYYLISIHGVGTVNSEGRGNARQPHDLEPLIPPHEASQYSYTELMDRLKAGEVECV